MQIKKPVALQDLGVRLSSSYLISPKRNTVIFTAEVCSLKHSSLTVVIQKKLLKGGNRGFKKKTYIETESSCYRSLTAA